MFKLDTTLPILSAISRIEANRTSLTRVQIIRGDIYKKLVVNGSFICFIDDRSNQLDKTVNSAYLDRLIDTLKRMDNV